jgi:predicted nucleic acid-binding protein
LSEATGSNFRVYFDRSALIERSVQEAESDAVEAALDRYVAAVAVAILSSPAWGEVRRALRARLDGRWCGDDEIHNAFHGALAEAAERFITEEVLSLARRVAPPPLRTLDAIHLATAIVLDVDEVVAYDDRLIDACRSSGLALRCQGADVRDGPAARDRQRLRAR